MTNNINYQKELDKLLLNLEKNGDKPSLLLHSCCAPCSSYCLEYLAKYFSITVFYFNPNISPEEEYRKRVEEQKRFIRDFFTDGSVSFIEGDYKPDVFYNAVKGMEKEPEGGKRCFVCYSLRLEEAASMAKDKDFDYFTTTLTISPLKNSAKLNEIGKELSDKYGVKYLYSDFKKKEGYKRSIELSKKYHLYRQNFCGCIFSKMEADKREQN